MSQSFFLKILTIGFFVFSLFSAHNIFASSVSKNVLSKLTLEELMNVDISIATKKGKKLSSVAAPVFIISAEDIRHSGVRNIPEVLRMAPGVQVAQIGPHDWSVTIRGFNDMLVNKILVLVDGRTVYSPTVSGTYWRELQSIGLENIKRIEIIRGPGGTIWGANAVNGVINIITYTALETEGGKVIAGGGTEQRAFAGFRYTKKITEEVGFKIYANYFKVDGGKGLNGSNNEDGGDGWRTGTRFDFKNKTDQFSIDGNLYEHYLQYNSLHTLLVPPYSEIRNTRPSFQGGHVTANWSHKVAEDNQWSIQTFYDYNHRNDAVIQVGVDVWDIDFNHQFSWDDRHTITWGGGYRHIRDDATNTQTFALNPVAKDLDIYNIFAQNEISLDSDKNWLFTLGSKFEYHSLSKWEVQPSASLLWHINKVHSFWVSASHAVRTPSRNQHDIQVFFFNQIIPPSTPLFFQGSGKNGIDAENMTAYQLGWRGNFGKNITADVSLFYHDYKDLIRAEMTGAIFLDGNGFAILPGQVNNVLDAQSYGVEVAVNWQVFDWWRNYFIYSHYKLNSQPQQGHTLFTPDSDEHLAPQQIVSMRSHFLLTDRVDLNFWLRYTDQTVTSGRDINDFFTLDLRLGWQVNHDLELSLVGQNLIQTNHAEFGQGQQLYPIGSKVERGVYGKLAWSF